MKMQRMKDFVMGAVAASLVVGVTPAAFAKVASMNIPIQYNNIKVLVDGKELRTEKEPFIYDGTTYLPLRAVAEAVGKEVSWDSATKTAILSGGGAVAQPKEETLVEPKQEDTEQKSDRWIRITNKTHAQGGTVEIKCTDVRENLENGMLELDFKVNNTGSINYTVWNQELTINGKKVPSGAMYADAYSYRKSEDTMRIKLSDLDAADIDKIYEIRMAFTVHNVDGGRGFTTNEMIIQFKS